MEYSLNIALIEPEIPQNTGNIARTCAATGARLHLVGPMGFTITDKQVKRAGLDYWDKLDITFYDSQEEFFEKKHTGVFRIFAERTTRLQEETQVLREYAMQVQDVYQSEIGIRQNNVMKVLTIVTTVFLPLTLIAGWYGMNFVYMPELKWVYGYPVAIGASILVIIVSLWIFKKKKYL